MHKINCGKLIGTLNFQAAQRSARIWFCGRARTGGRNLKRQVSWCQDMRFGWPFGLSNSKRLWSFASPTLIICIWFALFSFSLSIDFSRISIGFFMLLPLSKALSLILNPLLLQIRDTGWSSISLSRITLQPMDRWFCSHILALLINSTEAGNLLWEVVLFKSFHSFIQIHSSIHSHRLEFLCVV